MVAGSNSFAPDPTAIPVVLVGRILAEELKISAGDYVTLTSPAGKPDAIRHGAARRGDFAWQEFSIPASTITTRIGDS